MLEFKDQLKRDYQKDPLKYGECPEYEDLYFLYITCNLTSEEMAPYFGLKACTVKSRLRKLKIIKSNELKQEAMKRKMIEKYGVAKYAQTPEFKQKMKEISLKKYGVDHPLKAKEVRENIKQTNLKKYGTEVASKNKDVKNKTKNTCRERYGVDAYFQTQQFKDKSKETCLEKYGVEYGSQSEYFQNKVKETNMKNLGVPYPMMSKDIIEKSKQTCLQKWGTSNISTSHIDPKILELINNKDKLKEYIDQFEVKDFHHIAKTLGISYDGLQKKLYDFDLWDKYEHRISHAETELKELFDGFNKTRQIIAPYEIDLYNDSFNLGIEFNGIYWHSELFKDCMYHQNKSKLADDKGIFLFQIFEHEWIDDRKRPILISMINNLLRNSNRIQARKCIISTVNNTECDQFLNENHLQGKDNSSIRLGLYYNDELVSVMTFCKPRFNKNYEYELSRFCTKLNTIIVGGASKLFNHFINNYDPNNIISYSNISKTRGLLYSKLGFSLHHVSKPNYVWFKGFDILSRYQCQKHLLKEYINLGSTEDEIMHARGYLKLYDCGNKVWTWCK